MLELLKGRPSRSRLNCVLVQKMSIRRKCFLPNYHGDNSPESCTKSSTEPAIEPLKGARRFFYNLSAAGWTLLDSMLLTYYIVFLLPPQERIDQGMIQFVSDRHVIGGLTALGAIMLFGRAVAAVADPLGVRLTPLVGSAVALLGLFVMLKYREPKYE